MTNELQINKIISKANARLGLIKRLTFQKFNRETVRRLYITLVRPILEYNSIIFSPITVYQKTRIESIQKQFVIYALHNTEQRNNNYQLRPYNIRCEVLQIQSLERRRINYDITFIYDLINGFISSNFILDQIEIIDNDRINSLRNPQIIRLHDNRLSLNLNNNLSRMCRHFIIKMILIWQEMHF